MKKSWKSFMTVTAAAAAMTAAMAFSSLAAVAKVGEVEYDDLQTAVNSGDDVVIDLLDDVTLTDGLVIGAGKNVTIQCQKENPKTITMNSLGIITGSLNGGISNVTFTNCMIDENVINHPEVQGEKNGATTNLFTNTNLKLDHVTWTLKSSGDQIGKHGIYLNAETKLYISNGSAVEISGFNSSGSSGLFQDASDRTQSMSPVEIVIDNGSELSISDCGYGGITVDEPNMTVSNHSKIYVTNCGLNGGRGGIQCLGTCRVENGSSIISNNNVGRLQGAFFNHLYLDGTSDMSVCGNKGARGLRIGGTGVIDTGAKLNVDRNEGTGLQIHTGQNFYFGNVQIKPGAKVSICENGKSGIDNYYKFSAENGAELMVKKNKGCGIRNYNEMSLDAGSICENETEGHGAGILNDGTMINKAQSTAKLKIGTGVRICNNHAAIYGGGLYNGENGTAELSDGVILYNNHAAKGADDIYNTAGRKLTFCAVGTGWNLDDCNHRIDGWYDDTEGSRWNADDNLPENRHIVSVASGEYETGFQIKAAHGADIYETTSYPIDKKADGEDEIGTVSQGKKIRFTLTSSLPKLLARYVVTASNASPANSARKIRKVRVHSASGAGTVRVHSASGAETVRVYSASGARRARSVSGDNYDNEISAQSLSSDEKYAIPDSVVETMVFHDKMNRYLKFIDGTLRVTAGRDGIEVPSGYYTVTASGSNAFQVEIDLVNLFNTGIIDYEDLTGENPITVTYEAVVTDDTIQGDELFNEAWVNDGEHDSVEGDVLDKKVPSTGGMGRGMFTGLGLLFMGTAVAAWKRKRSM